MDIDRYEYVPALSTVTIRMPGQIHEQMILETTFEIKSGPRSLIDTLTPHEEVLASLLSKIKLSNTANFNSASDPHHSRSPDQQLHYYGFLCPRLTIEVSHDTILMTEVNMRIVIGLEIGYRRKNDEVVDRVLVWEPTVSGTSPGLSSTCKFDEVSLQPRPLCKVLRAKLIAILVGTQGTWREGGATGLKVPIHVLIPSFLLDQNHISYT